eukprot:1030993-Alexandrium_andersonii.AAC.1
MPAVARRIRRLHLHDRGSDIRPLRAPWRASVPVGLSRPWHPCLAGRRAFFRLAALRPRDQYLAEEL